MAHETITAPPAGPLTLHGHDVEGVNRCVHCGLCLAYCPTFSILGTEMDSPRGRIFLVKSLAEGRLKLSDATVSHLDLCLGCRACETVCPSGVPYGQLIEAARAEIERQRPGGPLRRLFRWVNFAVLLPRPRLLGLAAAGLRFYQVSGLRSLARATGLLKLLPSPLADWEPLLPSLPPWRERAPLPELTPAASPRRARVGMLTGCIQQIAFGSQNRATARVLARNGAEVVAPRAQTCCGALHAHAGEHDLAVALAKRTIEVFEAANVDAVVVNTSGCGAHMKAYDLLLAEDPAWRERAARFTAKVRDLAEFLATEPLKTFEEQKSRDKDGKGAKDAKAKDTNKDSGADPNDSADGGEKSGEGMMAGVIPGSVKKDEGKKLLPATPWGRYVKILLSSSEFLFVD
jgi:glycolate oxidase iron-sulfur subunit